LQTNMQNRALRALFCTLISPRSTVLSGDEIFSNPPDMWNSDGILMVL